MYKPKLQLTTPSPYLYFSSTIILAIFFTILLIEQINNEINFYDFMLNLIDQYTCNFFIIPLFLFWLTNKWPATSLNNLSIIRFKTKKSYYQAVIRSLITLSLQYSMLVIGIIFLLSIFSLDFKNNWSVYANQSNDYSPEMFHLFTPILYTSLSLLLFTLAILFFSLFYFFILILTKNTTKAVLFCLTLILINMVINLNRLNFLLNFSFSKNWHIFSFIDLNHSTILSTFSPPFVYWILLILLTYTIGLYTINNVDLDRKKAD